MTTPPLRIFSDTASTSTVDPKPLAELDFSDVDLLLEGDTPVVSIEGLESKVKQQVGQILATAATALSADWTAIYLLMTKPRTYSDRSMLTVRSFSAGRRDSQSQMQYS